MLYYANYTVKPVPRRDGSKLTMIGHGQYGKLFVNQTAMRTRPLVLTTESARHPFRQRLPRHVLAVASDAPTSRKARAASDDSDWKLFMLSFVAFFTAFYSFIG